MVSYLVENEKSISALTKDLQKDGHKLHRLMVTGYLKALADVGVLREREVPPSKIYTVLPRAKEDLYNTMGEKCRDLPMEPHDQAKVAGFVLQKLLKRPIFLTEIRRCGFDSIPAKQGSAEDIEEARKVLKKAGIIIPPGEPAFIVEEDLSEEMMTVMGDVLVEKFMIKGLVRDTRQVTLGQMRD